MPMPQNLSAVKADDPVAFLPGVRGEDPTANYWLRQAMLRLRREICWLWRERGTLAGANGTAPQGTLPRFGDRLSGAA